MTDAMNFQPSGISDKAYLSVVNEMMRLPFVSDSDCTEILGLLSRTLSLKRCLLVFTNAEDEWSEPLRYFEHFDLDVPLEFSNELKQELITIFEDLEEYDSCSRLTSAIAEATGFDFDAYATTSSTLRRRDFGECFGALTVMRDIEREFSTDELEMIKVTATLLQTTLDSKHWKNLFDQNRPRDPLSGLLSKREILKFCQWECQQLRIASFAPKTLALVGLDVDNLRRSNDYFGLGVTDDVLKTLSDCIRECVLPGQLGARFGGNEFVILLPDTEQREAETFAEVLRLKIAALKLPNLPKGGFCTASFGIALAPKHASTSEELLEKVIYAISVAKSKGKNCVVTLP